MDNRVGFGTAVLNAVYNKVLKNAVYIAFKDIQFINPAKILSK